MCLDLNLKLFRSDPGPLSLGSEPNAGRAVSAISAVKDDYSVLEQHVPVDGGRGVVVGLDAAVADYAQSEKSYMRIDLT